MNLNEIAARLYKRVDADGKPAEVEYQDNMKIILRPIPQGKIQLVTVGWGQHWPTKERPALQAAFNVPGNAAEHFQIVKGWHIWKQTWDRPGPAQLGMFEAEQMGLFPDQDLATAGPKYYEEG